MDAVDGHLKWSTIRRSSFWLTWFSWMFCWSEFAMTTIRKPQSTTEFDVLWWVYEVFNQMSLFVLLLYGRLLIKFQVLFFFFLYLHTCKFAKFDVNKRNWGDIFWIELCLIFKLNHCRWKKSVKTKVSVQSKLFTVFLVLISLRFVNSTKMFNCRSSQWKMTRAIWITAMPSLSLMLHLYMLVEFTRHTK